VSGFDATVGRPWREVGGLPGAEEVRPAAGAGRGRAAPARGAAPFEPELLQAMREVSPPWLAPRTPEGDEVVPGGRVLAGAGEVRAARKRNGRRPWGRLPLCALVLPQASGLTAGLLLS
jgi:hypothetical protein